MTFGTKKENEILRCAQDDNAKMQWENAMGTVPTASLFLHDYNSKNVDAVIMKAKPEESHLYKSFFIVNTASCVLSLRSSLISTLVIWFFTVP